MFTHLLPLLAPLALVAASIALLVTPVSKADRAPLWSQAATLIALAIAGLSAVLLAALGPGTSVLIGANGIGLSARIDMLSVVMIMLVCFIGWVVVRYAATYLAEEDGQATFMGWLLALLAGRQSHAARRRMDRHEPVPPPTAGLLSRPCAGAARRAQEVRHGPPGGRGVDRCFRPPLGTIRNL